MESEESIKINSRRLVRLRSSRIGRAGAADAASIDGSRNRDRRTQIVILLLGVWDDRAQAVHRAALKDGDQNLPAPLSIRLSQRARQERRRHHRGAHLGQRDAAAFQEKPSVHLSPSYSIGLIGPIGPMSPIGPIVFE